MTFDSITAYWIASSPHPPTTHHHHQRLAGCPALHPVVTLPSVPSTYPLPPLSIYSTCPIIAPSFSHSSICASLLSLPRYTFVRLYKSSWMPLILPLTVIHLSSPSIHLYLYLPLPFTPLSRHPVFPPFFQTH